MLKKTKKIYKEFFIIIIPILFEIVNEITGDWINDSGSINFTIGKFITALIAIYYIGQSLYYIVKDKSEESKIEEQNKEIQEYKKQDNIYQLIVKSLCNILNYTTDKIKDQDEYYKRNSKINTEYVNIEVAATRLCESIYGGIIKLTDKECDVTVNFYKKYSKNDRRDYSMMIAHEGYNTEPKNYGISKLLKMDRDTYYCEKLLIDDNFEAVFLKDKKEVAKAFGLKPDRCKYNQYVGIPIRRFGSEKVALIEIVVHNECKVWETQEEVRIFMNRYCEPFKDYILLIDRLTLFYETIDNAKSVGQERGVKDESKENIELSQKGY